MQGAISIVSLLLGNAIDRFEKDGLTMYIEQESCNKAKTYS